MEEKDFFYKANGAGTAGDSMCSGKFRACHVSCGPSVSLPVDMKA